eukprot:4745297-Alexandrium_andersonii.AAC.1
MFLGGILFGKAPERWNLSAEWCFTLAPDIIVRKSTNKIVNELDWDKLMDTIEGDGNLRSWA